jgi:hypothetical protein
MVFVEVSGSHTGAKGLSHEQVFFLKNLCLMEVVHVALAMLKKNERWPLLSQEVMHASHAALLATVSHAPSSLAVHVAEEQGVL